MRVAVFTSGRQDWGILTPVVRELARSSHLTVQLIASGMHCRDGRRPERLDDQPIDILLPILPERDDDLEIARVAGETTTAVADALQRLKAEALLLLGDRTETLAAGLAATCLRLPIIHLHGGEETTGAIDNVCRHALTKLAHLHLVAHQRFRERIVAMGVAPERVVVCGAPAIDHLLATGVMDRQQLASEIGVPTLGQPLIVFTYHPTTLSAQTADQEIATVLTGIKHALGDYPQANLLITRANCDAGGMAINAAVERFAAQNARVHTVSDLGTRRYWSLLSHATVLVGNSSSGILEAPSFDLPVINIGDRQGGRLRVHDVRDVPVDGPSIAKALREVLRHPRSAVTPHASAYGDGQAAQRIRKALELFAADHIGPYAHLEQYA